MFACLRSVTLIYYNSVLVGLMHACSSSTVHHTVRLVDWILCNFLVRLANEMQVFPLLFVVVVTAVGRFTFFFRFCGIRKLFAKAEETALIDF